MDHCVASFALEAMENLHKQGAPLPVLMPEEKKVWCASESADKEGFIFGLLCNKACYLQTHLSHRLPKKPAGVRALVWVHSC